jgi:NADPH:quinone reductase-like Zn-dependent oxidoreductase
MQFKPGEVFGICKGAFAEYVCAPESGLAIKPENLTFEQAASSVEAFGPTSVQFERVVASRFPCKRSPTAALSLHRLVRRQTLYPELRAH